MIITRTPFRVSFLGGGSDFKEFYSRSTGYVVSVTINKYMYLSVHPRFDEKIQLKYSKTELVNDPSELEHGIAREILKMFSAKGLDIDSISDIPASCGLSTSSAYAVGLIHALDGGSREFIAQKACEIEIDKLNKRIGKQDQYACAYGGLNAIEFQPDGSVRVESIVMNPFVTDELERNLMLFYLGEAGNQTKVLEEQVNSYEGAGFEIVKKMVAQARELKKALTKSDISEFGRYLNLSWELKKKLSSGITNHAIDSLIGWALRNGAEGAKLLGSGGGGFLLIYCRKEHQNELREALRSIRELRFKLDMQGTQTIYRS